MHNTEPRWNIDFQLRGEKESVNDYADLLIKRMETAHEIVRQNLGVTANKMSMMRKCIFRVSCEVIKFSF